MVAAVRSGLRRGGQVLGAACVTVYLVYSSREPGPGLFRDGAVVTAGAGVV